MGEHWQDLGLVFPTSRGTLLDPAKLRQSLRTVTEQAGFGRWHPRELRRCASSVLSTAGVPLREVADVGTPAHAYLGDVPAPDDPDGRGGCEADGADPRCLSHNAQNQRI